MLVVDVDVVVDVVEVLVELDDEDVLLDDVLLLELDEEELEVDDVPPAAMLVLARTSAEFVVHV